MCSSPGADALLIACHNRDATLDVCTRADRFQLLVLNYFFAFFPLVRSVMQSKINFQLSQFAWLTKVTTLQMHRTPHVNKHTHTHTGNQ